MRWWHLFGVIWVCIMCEATLPKRCTRRSSEVAVDRRCRKPCVADSDCKAANKTCNCDEECGMSCYNVGAVCSEPDTIPHGRVIRKGLTMQSVATYLCSAGYIIEGTRKRICSADKKWYPPAPRCKSGCSRPSRISYAYLPAVRESFRVGEKATYRCRTGYYTYADRRITCMKSGRWSEANFRCQRKICRAIATVLNGRINYSSNYYFGSIATLQCIRGFDLQHKGRRQICTTGRAGSSTGAWSGPHLGECLRKDCPSPLSPRNGRFEYTSSNTKNEYETEIRYLCDVGFRLEGNSSSICDYTGSWGEPPDCVDVKCTQPPTSRPHATRSGISHASGNLLLPESTVHYRCRQKYKVSGHRVVLHYVTSTCQYRETSGNSAWNPTLESIACEEIFCNRPRFGPNHMLHTDKQSWRVGERVTAFCKEGYEFSLTRFVDTVTCTDSGDWDSSYTPCEDKRCPETRRYIPHGERVSISNTEVTYRCNENYQFYGSNLVKTKTVKCIRRYLFWRSHWAVDLDRLWCQRTRSSQRIPDWRDPYG